MSHQNDCDLIDIYLRKLEETDDVAPILEQAINDPDLIFFSEILEHPKVAVLPPDSEIVKNLTLFAYGEWTNDFKGSQSAIIKLKKLTILSACLEFGRRPIPFDYLMARAGIENTVTLFRTILAMTSLVSVRINEETETVRVIDIHVGRDVPSCAVPALLEKLSDFKQTVDSLINS